MFLYLVQMLQVPGWHHLFKNMFLEARRVLIENMVCAELSI